MDLTLDDKLATLRFGKLLLEMVCAQDEMQKPEVKAYPMSNPIVAQAVKSLRALANAVALGTVIDVRHALDRLPGRDEKASIEVLPRRQILREGRVMEGVDQEDFQGIIDRATDRWENIVSEFRSQMTHVVDQDLKIAGKKLATDGDDLCAHLLGGPNEAPAAIDRWNLRAVTFEKAVKVSPENTPGRLEFAVDLVAAGKNLAMLLEALAPPTIEEPPAPKDEDPLVARVRAELWAPGKLPTPESVAAFVMRAVVGAAPAELAIQAFVELQKKHQEQEDLRELALTFFAKAATAINDTERRFLQDMVTELARAKVKYPDPRRRFAALVSEVGEVATAFLRETPERVRDEAVQVAVVALRIATDGDPSLDGEP